MTTHRTLEYWLSPQGQQELMDSARRADEARKKRGEMTYDEWKVSPAHTPLHAAHTIAGDGIGLGQVWEQRSNDDIIEHIGSDKVGALTLINDSLLDGRNVLLRGPVGTGKTSLAVVAYRLYAAQQRLDEASVFAYWPILAVSLCAGDWNGGAYKASRLAKTNGLLVMDDIGVSHLTGQENRRRLEYADALVFTRHETGAPTIYTTNLEPHTLTTQIGERIASRLLEYTQVYIGGTDLRRQQLNAKERVR